MRKNLRARPAVGRYEEELLFSAIAERKGTQIQDGNSSSRSFIKSADVPNLVITDREG